MSTPPIRNGVRTCRTKAKRNPFVGLETEGKSIGIQFRAALGGEEHMRRGPKLNPDFAGAEWQGFASPQIERHTRPPPVIDQKLQSDKCFDTGVGRHVSFFAISRNAAAVAGPPSVLPSHGFTQQSSGLRLNRTRILSSSLTASAWKEMGAHGRQCDELKQMVGIMSRNAPKFHSSSHAFRHPPFPRWIWT